MVKIGLISESEYDHEALKALLLKMFSNIQIIRLLKRYEGTQLDTLKAQIALKTEYGQKRPQLVILQRDLDAPTSDAKKVKERQEYFSQTNKQINNVGLPLLHIQELEALILADTTSFNKRFNTSLNYTKNPEHQEKPKEYLKSKSGINGYRVSDCPRLIAEIDIEKARVKLNYFHNFLTQFEQHLKSA